jgi:hypothetical protein
MKLRDHPRISYKGIPSWPPVWAWRGGNRYSQPAGEVGVLKEVKLSAIEPCESCFLIIEHEGQEYVGALLFEDPLFCRAIYRLLIEHCGTPIQHVAEIDISYPRGRTLNCLDF